MQYVCEYDVGVVIYHTRQSLSASSRSRQYLSLTGRLFRCYTPTSFLSHTSASGNNLTKLCEKWAAIGKNVKPRYNKSNLIKLENIHSVTPWENHTRAKKYPVLNTYVFNGFGIENS